MIIKNLGLFKILFYVYFYWFIKVCFYKKNLPERRMETKRITAKITLDKLENEVIEKINFDGHLPKNEPNKVNILLANHCSTIDFVVISGLMSKFNIDNFYFIFKKSILKIPGFGHLLSSDISISRNWDHDKDNIVNQIKNIKEGYIIIYPEGTRFSTKKHKDSKKFSIENNLPIYNNTLTPRIKGTHLIFKTLQETGKLGGIYDMTLVFKNFIGQSLGLSKILSCSGNLGELDIISKKLKITENDLDYENFKEKIFKLWLHKNLKIDLIKKLGT